VSYAALALARPVVNDLLSSAQRHPGIEVCGFLVRHGNGCTVRPVRNIADDPSCRFEMDPADMVDAFRRAREDGEEVLAIYHSHPSGPATPSELDRRLAYYPDLPYLIVSLGTRGVLELRAFRFADGNCREIILALDEGR